MSTVKEIVAVFESASVAVTLTVVIPCLPSIGVIVIVDPSRVRAAGAAPLVDSETTRLSVTSPSMSLAFTGTFTV